MVFVEFSYTTPDGERKYYFIGASVGAILADTRGGTTFAGLQFNSRREVSYDHVQRLGFCFFTSGACSVQEGRARSYSLGSPLGGSHEKKAHDRKEVDCPG